MSGVEAHQEYIQSKINPVLEELVTAVLMERPADPVSFMVNWLANHAGIAAPKVSSSSGSGLTPAEKRELENLRTEVARLRNYVDELEGKIAGGARASTLIEPPMKAESDSEAESVEAEDDYVDELPELPKTYNTRKPRTSVSAEAYGQFNQKGAFTPRVIAKTEEQKQRIISCISEAFMFSGLEEHDRDVVINAMEERTFGPGETVINQGDDGDNLYVVDSGELEVYKKFAEGDPKLVKEYSMGDAFGELALLYNCPRAATVKTRTPAVLWSLDRETFNHIVKDAASKKRALHERFLESVELLSSMEQYERSKIADALQTKHFKEGEHIVREGEAGDTFYIIEEGEAYATKSLEAGAAPVEVMQYKPGGYFGELALLKNEPRAANVIAKTACKCVSLDRKSFKRLLGRMEDILKRNASRYELVHKTNA